MTALPGPVEDEFAGVFWEGSRKHQLLIERCQACGFWIHYPRKTCPSCLSDDVSPEPVSGRGHIESFTITHKPPLGPPDHAPVTHVLVELEEQPGLRIAATLEADQRPRIGDEVDVVFDDRDGFTLPRFRLRQEQER